MKPHKAHVVNRHLVIMALSLGVHGFEKGGRMVECMASALEIELDKAGGETKATEGDIKENRTPQRCSTSPS